MTQKDQVITFEDFPDSAVDEDSAEAELLGEESKPKSYSMISLEFYQQFFDVDTRKVCQRLFWSMVPRPGVSYLQQHIRPKPDLYGPVWTCLTLVFSVAISGNLAIYLQEAASGKGNNFKTDFRKVSYAASAFISYVSLIPVVLWAFLWWRRREHQPAQSRLALLEAICLYGYSLAIYIPVSVLLVVDIVWFRWSLVLLASVLSGSVLVSSLWPSVKGDDKKIGVIVSAVVICFHVFVAVMFMMFFFLTTPPLNSKNEINSATEKPLAQAISDTTVINNTLQTNKSDSLPVAHSMEGKDIKKEDLEKPLAVDKPVETKKDPSTEAKHKAVESNNDSDSKNPLAKGKDSPGGGTKEDQNLPELQKPLSGNPIVPQLNAGAPPVKESKPAIDSLKPKLQKPFVPSEDQRLKQSRPSEYRPETPKDPQPLGSVNSQQQPADSVIKPANSDGVKTPVDLKPIGQDNENSLTFMSF